MAEARILYWKEIPAQVQARDAQNECSILLQERFQQGIDSIAMQDGSTGTDQYLDGWQWGKYKEINGNADEVSKKLAKAIEENYPKNFTQLILKMDKNGTRNPSPGSTDHWMKI